MATLEITGLRKTFGGVVALAGVDMTIRSEEILGVIGPNGSGKTTLFNTVCGVYRPTSGTIHWNGVDIAGKPAYAIGRLGLGRTFQQAMSFPALTVRENVQIAIEHGSRREDGAGPQWSSAGRASGVRGLGSVRRRSHKRHAVRKSAPPWRCGRTWRDARRNSCLTSRPRDLTKAKVFNSFICSGALMNLEWGFASSITTLA